MVFEKACLSDVDLLSELRIKYLLEDNGKLSGETLSLLSSRLPEYFAAHLDKDLFAFVCREGESAVGCCMLYVSQKPPSPAFMTGRVGTVLNVYTEPDFRKKGIASALMNMLLDKSRELELDHVELKATEMGHGLYKRLGFEDEKSRYHAMKYFIKRIEVL